MKISILALGTRGDVQPMVALGVGLKRRGHDVTVLTAENFREFVEERGLSFLPTLNMVEIMASPEGVLWASSSDSPRRQLAMMKAIMTRHREEVFASVLETEGAELLISGLMTAPQAVAMAEAYEIPLVQVALCPTEPTRSGPASMLAPRSRAQSIFNLAAGHLAQRVLWGAVGETHNLFRERLGLKKDSFADWRRGSVRHSMVLAASPEVVPPAEDWGPPTTVTGFWFLEADEEFRPPEELEAFLDAGPPPIYVGFGSMSNAGPEQTVSLVSDAAVEADQRVLLAGVGSGVDATALPEQVFLLGNTPHEWLFPRCAGVIHHGGAGTTAAGLRAGKPCWVVPHMSDQPYWGRRMQELGVGLPPLPRHRLKGKHLVSALAALGGRGALHEEAEALGEKVARERGVESALQVVGDLL